MKNFLLDWGIWIAVAILFIFIAAFAPDDVEAQQRNCAPRESVVERLADGYGETRQVMGLGGNNQIMEVFASEETGTWTITITLPNGLTCLAMSGQAFQYLSETLPPKGDDL